MTASQSLLHHREGLCHEDSPEVRMFETIEFGSKIRLALRGASQAAPRDQDFVFEVKVHAIAL